MKDNLTMPIQAASCKIPEVPGDFTALLAAAQDALAHAEIKNLTEAVAFLTVKSNLYTVVIPDVLTDEMTEEKRILQTMRDADDTEIVKLLCLFPDCLEIPSCAFREMICRLHPNNKNAEILMNGGSCCIRRTVWQTLPPSVNERL